MRLLVNSVTRWRVVRAASLMLVALLITANAKADFVPLGDPVEGNSWDQAFWAHGQAKTLFDTITITVSEGAYTFKALEGFVKNWREEAPSKQWALYSSRSDFKSITMHGNPANWVGWTLIFDDAPPQKRNLGITLDLVATYQGNPVELSKATYKVGNNGNWVWQVKNEAITDQGTAAVPEPATLLAGALLLLPFGASAVRIVCRRARNRSQFP